MAMCDRTHFLSVEALWADPDLLEIEARVTLRDWAGVARAYTTCDALAEFARRLSAFADRLEGECAFDAGNADTGVGLVSLRFCVLDRARHTACRARLTTRVCSNEPLEGRFSMSVQLLTEPLYVSEFAGSLLRIAHDESGTALLAAE